jgi:hypothetical protein
VCLAALGQLSITQCSGALWPIVTLIIAFFLQQLAVDQLRQNALAFDTVIQFIKVISLSFH